MIAFPASREWGILRGWLSRLLLGILWLGSFTLVSWQAAAADYSFTNATPIQIPDMGMALPYPATISVANVTGVVAKITVTLNKLTHTRPSDIDIVLVGPEGQSVVLLSDAGGFAPVTDLKITFDDRALAPEREFSPLVSGTFQPINYGGGDTFPAPAPAGSAATALSVFNGTNPNGNW